MKQKILKISRRYEAELRMRLQGRSEASAKRAESLGKKAMKEGLETLDIANIHGECLVELMPINSSEAVRKRTVKVAGIFFLEVITPIERTHRSMIEGYALLKVSNGTLRQRTVELTASNTSLKLEVAHRKAAERALKVSERSHRSLLRDARRMQMRLRHLSHQVIWAQEAERREISRELHDDIVQTLTGINVQLASLKVEAGVSSTKFSKHISYTQQLVEKSVDIVHRFARELRPTLLDDLGLIPALHAYLKAFTARTGLQVGFTAYGGVERLSNDKRTVLYRVAQASLVNIAQHAKASVVSVRISKLARAVVMEVRDNGTSFDVTGILDSRRNKRLGLVGMRERVEMVGGTFRVESSPGHGTTITSTIPFKQK